MLTYQGSRDAGYAQTKARCVALTAISDLMGTPSPYHLVRTCRAAALHTKHLRRGRVTGNLLLCFVTSSPDLQLRP